MPDTERWLTAPSRSVLATATLLLNASLTDELAVPPLSAAAVPKPELSTALKLTFLVTFLVLVLELL